MRLPPLSGTRELLLHLQPLGGDVFSLSLNSRVGLGCGERSWPGPGEAGGERCSPRAALPDVRLFLLSDQQMRGKTASLKSSVSCSEKLARVQAPLDSR